MKPHFEPLTFAAVVRDPGLVAWKFLDQSGKEVIFRPLMADDVDRLAGFLARLSSETRRFSTYDGYDKAVARDFCDAIARYDKFRMVAVVNEWVVALFEFAFWISDSDKDRFHSYGIDLNDTTDVKFGPCIADDDQNHGLGTQLMQRMASIARLFGKYRIILWGGVLSDNTRAIRYYEKNGFQMLGAFTNASGLASLDGILTL